MTTDLVTLTPESSLFDAHQITKEKGIRHIPVVNDQGQIIAIATQKVLIANVMQILSDFGERAIERKEKLTDILNVAETDFDTVTADRKLVDIAEFFLMNKHGCLPVVEEDNKLVGMITSSDFVRLSARLLENIEG
jgi:CBS domain-containing protein